MSVEALWYSSYIDGEPPVCARLSRRPVSEQWQAPMRMALSSVGVGWRNCWIARTGERYYHWPDSDSDTGWWLIPYRVSLRYHHLMDAATRTALETPSNRPWRDRDDVRRVLLRWQRTGHWRRIIASVHPRHAPAQQRGNPLHRKLPLRMRRRLEALRRQYADDA